MLSRNFYVTITHGMLVNFQKEYAPSNAVRKAGRRRRRRRRRGGSEGAKEGEVAGGSATPCMAEGRGWKGGSCEILLLKFGVIIEQLKKVLMTPWFYC
jgi:hypothetical protein